MLQSGYTSLHEDSSKQTDVRDNTNLDALGLVRMNVLSIENWDTYIGSWVLIKFQRFA